MGVTGEFPVKVTWADLVAITSSALVTMSSKSSCQNSDAVLRF
jgi:hypothetical protein